MKYIAILLFTFLVGCNTINESPAVKTYSIQLPESPRTKCYNSIPSIPNTENLTNRELIEYISRLIRSNKICKSAVDSVYNYVEQLQRN